MRDAKGFGVLQAVPRSHGHAGQKEMCVGGTVRAAKFHGLVVLEGTRIKCRLIGVGVPNHAIAHADPAKRNANEHGAIPVPPADARGGFLMGNQAKERGRDRVPERREGLSAHEEPGDHLPGRIRESVRVGHHIHVVLHEPRMDVHTAARLAHDDLGREAHFQVVLVGHFPDGPLGHHQLVGGVLDGHRQEFDLVLHHFEIIADDVADLCVTVLDQPAHFADHTHGLAPNETPLREGMCFVVALLLDDGIDPIHLREKVVLQFPQGLHAEASALFQPALGLP